jgi:hypothetical protein
MLKKIFLLLPLFFEMSCSYSSHQATLTRDCLWMFSYTNYSSLPTHAYRFYQDGTLDYYAFCNDSLKHPDYLCKVGSNPEHPSRWQLIGDDSIKLDNFWYKIQKFNADTIVLINTYSETFILITDFETLKKVP